jgi:CheY-like chemotaxis protein
MARVTVVNDNPEFLDLVHDILEDDRYDATTVDGDRPDALHQILESRPELLMIDLRLGAEGLHGWEIAQKVRREPGLDSVPVLVCSGDMLALQQIESDLAETQRVEALTKPFSVDQLTDAIDRLLASAAAR